MENVSARVRIEGRVQGVCFRMETQIAARERGLSGWVKNLVDGRVEALFEGPKDKVESMLAWCETGPPMARVNRVAIAWEVPSGEFKNFRVTF